MRNPPTVWEMLAWTWLAISGCVTVVYRAWTQSFTIDEGYVFKDFLQPDIGILFQQYNASYHVLHTWASWFSLHLLGTSEIAARLPSVIAGLLYLWIAGVLSRRLLGGGWRMLFGVILLSASPLVADYLSIARGYGAALAFFAWGFDSLLADRARRAAILFALSVCANLTFAAPVAGASFLFVAFQRWNGTPVTPVFRRLAIPFLAVSLPILAAPLWHANRGYFYFGADSSAQSFRTLVSATLFHNGAPAPGWAETAAAFGVGIAVVASMGAGSAAALRRELATALAPGTLAVSLLIVTLAHLLLGVPYPYTRTGLYLIWLSLVACLASWGWCARNTHSPRKLEAAFGAISITLAIWSIAQFDTRFYYDYRDDAEMKTIMLKLREAHSGGNACVGGSWAFEHTVYYYRLRYGMDWLEEMKRTSTPQKGCTYFILTPGDRHFAQEFQLRTLWVGPISGTALAKVQ
jgi:hypothetical protein